MSFFWGLGDFFAWKGSFTVCSADFRRFPQTRLSLTGLISSTATVGGLVGNNDGLTFGQCRSSPSDQVGIDPCPNHVSDEARNVSQSVTFQITGLQATSLSGVGRSICFEKPRKRSGLHSFKWPVNYGDNLRQLEPRTGHSLSWCGIRWTTLRGLVSLPDTHLGMRGTVAR